MKKFLIVLAVLALVSFTLPACQTNQAKPEYASRAGMIERIGILCQGGGDCIEGWNGSTIKLYSDAGTTNRFSVDSGVGEVKIAAPTAIGTATPVVIISGGKSVLLEARNPAGTPVFAVNADGSATYTGFSSAGGEVAAAAAVAAPTAVGTATPAFYVNSAGVSNLFEARKNATPVFQVNGSGNTTVAGTLGIMGSTTVGGLFLLSEQGNVTVTDGGEIAATKSFVPLTAAGAVGTSNITTGAAGQLLVLMNVGSNTITITDSGTIMLAGDCALGQYDTLTLISDGTNWLEITRANN